MAANEGSRNDILRDFGLFAIVGSEILGFTGAGVGLGYWAWTHWGFPWWTVVVTSLLGLVGAMLLIVRSTQRLSGRSPKAED